MANWGDNCFNKGNSGILSISTASAVRISWGPLDCDAKGFFEKLYPISSTLVTCLHHLPNQLQVDCLKGLKCHWIMDVHPKFLTSPQPTSPVWATTTKWDDVKRSLQAPPPPTKNIIKSGTPGGLAVFSPCPPSNSNPGTRFCNPFLLFAPWRPAWQGPLVESSNEGLLYGVFFWKRFSLLGSSS